MTESVRDAFLARRGKFARSIRSGDKTAWSRLDALIVEMSQVLGKTDRDALATELRYLELVSGRVHGKPVTDRSAATIVDAIQEGFGYDHAHAVVARFLVLFEDLERVLDDLYADGYASERSDQAQPVSPRDDRAEPALMNSVRDRFVKVIGDRAAVEGDDAPATLAGDALGCVELLFADEVKAASNGLRMLRVARLADDSDIWPCSNRMDNGPLWLLSPLRSCVWRLRGRITKSDLVHRFPALHRTAPDAQERKICTRCGWPMLRQEMIGCFGTLPPTHTCVQCGYQIHERVSWTGIQRINPYAGQRS